MFIYVNKICTEIFPFIKIMRFPNSTNYYSIKYKTDKETFYLHNITQSKALNYYFHPNNSSYALTICDAASFKGINLSHIA